MKGFPHETPNPSWVQANALVPVPIPLGPAEAVILTAPEIKGGDVTKKIELTVVLEYTGPEQVTFTLYRDGAAQPLTYMHEAGLAAPETNTVSMHWIDVAPGKAEPVYEVRASGNVGAVTSALSRQLSVFNA